MEIELTLSSIEFHGDDGNLYTREGHLCWKKRSLNNDDHGMVYLNGDQVLTKKEEIILEKSYTKYIRKRHTIDDFVDKMNQDGWEVKYED